MFLKSIKDNLLYRILFVNRLLIYVTLHGILISKLFTILFIIALYMWCVTILLLPWEMNLRCVVSTNIALKEVQAVTGSQVPQRLDVMELK